MAAEKVKFVSKEKLLEMMTNKEKFKLVEVLPKDNYEEGHLPFASNIPVTELEESAPKELPDKKELIVVYCSSFTCGSSTSAAKKLQAMGYENVLDFKGGKTDWKEAGLPLAE